MQIEFSKNQITDPVVFYDGANNYISLNQRYFSTNRESQIIERLKGMDKDLNGINNQYSDKFDISNHYLYSTKFLINKFITKLSPTKNLTTPKLLFNSQNDSLAATELLETWLLAKKYVESKNKRFICILQPTFFTSKSPKNNYIINSIDSSPFTNSTYNYYNLVRNFINKNKYKELKNNFYDFSFELNKKDSIYIDFCHLGPTGNNIIAEKIYNTIKN
jgi:hypothetical protein